MNLYKHFKSQGLVASGWISGHKDLIDHEEKRFLNKVGFDSVYKDHYRKKDAKDDIHPKDYLARLDFSEKLSYHEEMTDLGFYPV